MFFPTLRQLVKRMHHSLRRSRQGKDGPGRVWLRLETLGDRVTPSTVTWIGGSGDWNTGSDWSNGVGPGAGDDAVINTANITVTHSAGSHTVHSIALSNSALFSLAGGTLTLGTTFQVSSGASLTFRGGTLANATVTNSTPLEKSRVPGTVLPSVLPSKRFQPPCLSLRTRTRQGTVRRRKPQRSVRRGN